jgi:hypothetical protein
MNLTKSSANPLSGAALVGPVRLSTNARTSASERDWLLPLSIFLSHESLGGGQIVRYDLE